MREIRRRPATIGDSNMLALRADERGSRTYARIIDLGLLVTTIAAVATEAVVVWFHFIFVLLVVAALVLPLKALVIRLVVWALVATSLVTWDVVAHDTPSAELSEIPILTAVIVLVFLVARSREQSHQALRESQQLVRARLEADRDRLRSQLELSQRLDTLGRASNRIAHDLRGVLTIVRWCAADLLDDPDERHHRRGREAMEATQRGVDLVDEMLALGREHTSDDTVVDVLDVFDGAVPLLEHLVPDGVLFEVRTPPQSAEIRMSRTELLQILMNLVTNAVDATDRGGNVRLELDVVDRIAAIGRARRVVTISVADDGPGVDPELLPHIFDPGVTTKETGHSGLGLATVWTIVARAGGTVEFVSTQSGARVDIVLPQAADYVARRAVVDIADPDSCELLRDEFAALGFIVDGETADSASSDSAADTLVVVVHDDHAVVDGTVPPTAQVIDIRELLGPGDQPISPTEASIAVRRIVDQAIRNLRAA